MSPLPKHIRPRWRYLAFGLELWPTSTVSRRALQSALWTAARQLVGDAGSAEADLEVLQFDCEPGVGEGIIRTRRDTVRTARAALACVHTIEDTPVGVYVRGISGTIRACEERYIGGHQQTQTERQVVFENATRQAFERDDRLDIQTGDAFVGAMNLDFG